MDENSLWSMNQLTCRPHFDVNALRSASMPLACQWALNRWQVLWTTSFVNTDGGRWNAPYLFICCACPTLFFRMKETRGKWQSGGTPASSARHCRVVKYQRGSCFKDRVSTVCMQYWQAVRSLKPKSTNVGLPQNGANDSHFLTQVFLDLNDQMQCNSRKIQHFEHPEDWVLGPSAK